MGGRHGPTSSYVAAIAPLAITFCVFVALVTAACCFLPPPETPVGDTSKFRFVVCSDIFGATLYEGAVSSVYVKDGAVHMIEPSGTEVVIVNVECIIVKGTTEQINQSMQDHTAAEGPSDDDESF